MLSDFCVTANAISATTKKSEKERLLADYLITLDDASLERAVVFFSGSAFSRKDQRTVGVGGAALTEALVEVTGRSADEIWAAWSKVGDAGDTAAELFDDDPARTVTLAEVGETFERLAATPGAIEKKSVLVALLRKLDAQGVRYVLKILLREFRIGLQEGLVEAAIAKAFGRSLVAVRRANMLTGDIGAAALLARGDALESVKMNLFHPFAFMLAQPEEDSDEIVAMLGTDAFADDKYDGIRAQIHATTDEVRIYSRTLDDVTHRFPELEAAARKLGPSVVLDGEIVASRGRVLPFATIQTRLGRRKVSEALLRDAPVVFFAFVILFVDGEVLFEMPLRERLKRLRDVIGAEPAIRFTIQSEARDGANVDALFDAARARANEGLVVKAADSVYTPGRRGKSWLKYK